MKYYRSVETGGNIMYIAHCESPLGGITLASDREALCGLWFDGQKYFARGIDEAHKEELAAEAGGTGSAAFEKAESLPVFDETKLWLGIYFSGKEPDFSVPVKPVGTVFQKEVWEILREIPYGRTMTYGEIAGKLAQRRGIRKMSARAVGAAVGKNPVAVIVPCHRVVGAGGKLTGYAGGLEKKRALLELEGVM